MQIPEKVRNDMARNLFALDLDYMQSFVENADSGWMIFISFHQVYRPNDKVDHLPFERVDEVFFSAEDLDDQLVRYGINYLPELPGQLAERRYSEDYPVIMLSLEELRKNIIIEPLTGDRMTKNSASYIKDQVLIKMAQKLRKTVLYDPGLMDHKKNQQFS